MNKQFAIIIGKRFLKGFLSGGLASLLVSLQQAPQFSTFADAKPWLVALAISFISGGILAVEKLLQNYNPPLS